jgi:hypothetical protein
MAGDEERTAGKHYVIHDVGAGGRVIHGDDNTLIEPVQGIAGGAELQRQLEELLARIASAPDLDETAVSWRGRRRERWRWRSARRRSRRRGCGVRCATRGCS